MPGWRRGWEGRLHSDGGGLGEIDEAGERVKRELERSEKLERSGEQERSDRSIKRSTVSTDCNRGSRKGITKHDES